MVRLSVMWCNATKLFDFTFVHMRAFSCARLPEMVSYQPSEPGVNNREGYMKEDLVKFSRVPLHQNDLGVEAHGSCLHANASMPMTQNYV